MGPTTTLLAVVFLPTNECTSLPIAVRRIGAIWDHVEGRCNRSRAGSPTHRIQGIGENVTAGVGAGCVEIGVDEGQGVAHRQS